MRSVRKRLEGDPPVSANIPTVAQCLYHRCDDHASVPMLNRAEGPGQSECGACIAEELLAVKAQLLLALDGYAERLTYGRALARKLESARARLNLLSPGAGDGFDEAHDGKEGDEKEGGTHWRKEIGRRVEEA
jgi:hypothetical protein